MPIKVTCSACGKSFNLKDELAGKTGKCPCGAMLKVPLPAPAPAPQELGLSLVEPQAPAAALAPALAPAGGPSGAAEGSNGKCPGCGATTAGGAVICVQCGYNFKTRQKMAGGAGGVQNAFFKGGSGGIGGGLSPGKIIKYAINAVCILFLVGAGVWGFLRWKEKSQLKRLVAQLQAPVKYETHTLEASGPAADWARDYVGNSELWKVYFAHRASQREGKTTPIVKFQVDVVHNSVPGHKGYSGKDISFSPGSVTVKGTVTDLDTNQAFFDDQVDRGLPLVIVPIGQEPGPLDESFKQTEKEALDGLGDKLDLAAISLFKSDAKLREIVILGLVEKLGGNNSDIARSAAVALGVMGPDARSAILALVQQMNNPSQKVKNAVAESLGRIGGEGLTHLLAAIQSDNKNQQALGALAFKQLRTGDAQTVAALTPLLKNKDPIVRHCTGLALGNLGATSKEAVPALQEVLKDEDGQVRFAAAYALGQIGSDARAAIPDLIQRLSDAEVGVREEASRALVKFGAESVSLLVQATKEKNVDIARTAVQLLGQIEPVAESTVGALAEALQSPEVSVRATAAQVLSTLAEKAQPAYPALVVTMKDPVKDVRYAAYRSLEALKAEPAVLVPAMMKACQEDKDAAGDFRLTMIDALVKMGEKGPDVIGFFIEQMRDPVKDVRFHALRALEAIQPDPGRLAPGFIQAYQSDKDNEGDFRQHVIERLGDTGVKSPEVVQSLLAALRDDAIADVRLSSFNALKKVGSEAMPALIEAYRSDQNPSGLFRLAMVDLLALTGSKDDEVVKLFLDALKDPVKEVRLHGCRGIEAIHPEPGSVLPGMTEAYKLDKDGEGDFRAAVVNLVGRTAGSEPAAIALFKLSITDARPNIRKDSAKWLGRMGKPMTKDREVMAALRKASSDQDEEVSRAAKRGLGQIEGKVKILPLDQEEE
ncbi:MAG: HEAT repeat domain-containing protein [Planctomycetes bacterium]|nr:HEAT repeat domain-containing protein [Planctomycetota bacterium]